MSVSAVPALQTSIEAFELVELTMRGFDMVKGASSRAIEVLVNGSPWALQSIKTYEEELDSLDRELDQRMAPVITQVNPLQARELLACMKLMIDLERVGDLVSSFAERISIVRSRLEMQDIELLTRMACVLENMLKQIPLAFEKRDVDKALAILRADAEIDRFRNLMMVRHTEGDDSPKGQQSLHVLLSANALERAGDHVKNMAEEVCHVVTGNTIRHLMRGKDKPLEQLFLDWIARQSL